MVWAALMCCRRQASVLSSIRWCLGGDVKPGCGCFAWAVADEFDQAHNAAKPVGFAEEGFEALAQAVNFDHAWHLAGAVSVWLQALGHGHGHRQAAGANEENKFVTDMVVLRAGVDDAGNAGCGAHGGPVLAHEWFLEKSKEVAWKQGLGGVQGCGQRGAKALKPAVLQAVHGQVFLAWLGANEVPLFNSFIVYICNYLGR